MKRRNFLIGVGSTGFAGLAGCLSSPNLTSTAKTDSSLQRRVSLVSQDSVPEEHEIGITVELLEDTITDEHTAKLTFEIVNYGPARSLPIHHGSCDPFNRSRGGSDEPEGLWLYEEGAGPAYGKKEGKWVDDRSPEKPRGSANYACAPKQYESGESKEFTYEVWDDYQVDGYLKPDTYRWVKHSLIVEGSKHPDDERSEESFEWGFSLEVTDPNR